MDHIPTRWIDQFSRQLADLVPDQPLRSLRLGVAVSGGPDSLLLAVLALAWGRRVGVEVHGLCVDHGLRPESAVEASRVERDLGTIGLGCTVLRWGDPKPGHAAARTARYRLLAESAQARRLGFLLAAHHADDQRETVAMRLARGSDLQGLAGMSARRPLSDQVTILRPFLGLRRGTLLAASRRLGLHPIDDPSNRVFAFERTRWRAVLDAPEAVGLQRHAGDDLARLAVAAGRLRASIERQAVTFLKRDVLFPWWGGATLPFIGLQGQVPAVQRDILSRLILAVGGQWPSPSALAQRLKSLSTDRRPFVLGRCRVIIRREHLLVFPELGQLPQQPMVEPLAGNPAHAVVAGRFRVMGPQDELLTGFWRWLGKGARPAGLKDVIPDSVAATLPVLETPLGIHHPLPSEGGLADRSADQPVQFGAIVDSRIDQSVFAVVSQKVDITLQEVGVPV